MLGLEWCFFEAVGESTQAVGCWAACVQVCLTQWRWHVKTKSFAWQWNPETRSRLVCCKAKWHYQPGRGWETETWSWYANLWNPCWSALIGSTIYTSDIFHVAVCTHMCTHANLHFLPILLARAASLQLHRQRLLSEDQQLPACRCRKRWFRQLSWILKFFFHCV